MQFSAIYHNNGDVRTKALQIIYEALNKGADLSINRLRHQIVSTVPAWPDMATLLSLPMYMQCEHMEYNSGKLDTLRLLVIDVETIEQKVEYQAKTKAEEITPKIE
jgi:hypothetical protein